MSLSGVPVSDFVDGLKRIPTEEFAVDRVLEYLRTHPVDANSLQPYIHFRPGTYTRNLVFKNDLFELLVLCWDVGQVSHVHNHWEQRCWMAAPVGRLLVQNYRVVEGDGKQGHCRLETTGRVWMDAAAPAAVDPAEPIHSVANPAGHSGEGVRAITLHVYSRPYDRCVVYSLRDHRAREIGLRYDTQYGRGA